MDDSQSKTRKNCPCHWRNYAPPIVEYFFAAATLAVAGAGTILVADDATTSPATSPTTAATAPTKSATTAPTMPIAPDMPAEALTGNSPRAIYERTSPSLVAVQYTFTGETVQEDLIVPGIVVNDQGLVMIPLEAVSDVVPDEQMKKFKIIVPHRKTDNQEVEAEFMGRDERCNVAFVKAKASANPKQTWVPLHFDSTPSQVGDAIYSVGMLGKTGGYHTILAPGMVAANLRGPVKQVMVSGGSLASPGAPVFNSDGQAVGLVLAVPPASLSLDDVIRTQQQQGQHLLIELATNRYFIPTSEFAIALESPPTPDHPVPLAWTGLPAELLSGLTRADLALFNLGDQTAVQINDILPGSPAEKAGLKKKDIIIKVDGQPIDRGDQPEELPAILHHSLIAKKPGDVVDFTVISKKGDAPHDVKVTLETQPKRANAARRYWSEDIGFGVREMVLLDRYGLKLKKNDKDGVLVTVLKEGGSATSAGLHPYDMITQVNGQPVNDLDSFKTAYEDFRKDHEHEAIVLVVRRGGGDETIRIEPPQ